MTGPRPTKEVKDFCLACGRCTLWMSRRMLVGTAWYCKECCRFMEIVYDDDEEPDARTVAEGK